MSKKSAKLPADTSDDFEEPLSPQESKKLIREILENGTLVFSDPHALEEMKKDNLTELDIVNVLRAGQVDHPELEHGDYRYKFYTQKIVVIVSFRAKDNAVVITAWKLKSKGKWR